MWFLRVLLESLNWAEHDKREDLKNIYVQRGFYLVLVGDRNRGGG